LFVCLGNICRSPTAEGVFRALVEARGLEEHYEIDSAGTSGWHQGEPPDPRSREEARRHGVNIDAQRSRAVLLKDFESFDYLVAMDSANLRELRNKCPKAHSHKLHRLTAFAPDLGITDVPDPYYGGDRGFEDVYRIIEAGATGLLEAVESTRCAG